MSFLLIGPEGRNIHKFDYFSKPIYWKFKHLATQSTCNMLHSSCIPILKENFEFVKILPDCEIIQMGEFFYLSHIFSWK